MRKASVSCSIHMLRWLSLQELNSRGSHLLFRDKTHQLHLFNLATQQRSSLLGFCQYVQWVPGSDVVVAQSRGKLCVWYNINSPDRYVAARLHLLEAATIRHVHHQPCTRLDADCCLRGCLTLRPNLLAYQTVTA